MKKISLFKSLALLGAVALTSVCVTETVLLLKDKKGGKTDTKFDISTLNNYIIDYQLNSDNPTTDELLQLIKNNGVKPLSSSGNVKLADINDLIVIEDSIVNKSFILASRNNSATYEPDKNATIYFSTGVTQQLSSIITITPDLFLDKYVDETTTKANILINLKNQYPSLNINDLVVNSVTNLNDEASSAQVSARTGSMLYAGAVNVTYYTSGAAVLTYANPTIISGNSNILPTFTFRGETISSGVAYTCANVSAPISFTTSTGAFTYASNTYYAGGLFQVKASYTTGGNTFIAYANMFARPFQLDMYIGASTDVLNTLAGYKDLFAKAGVISTSAGFCKYQVTLASNVWAPIYTAIGRTSAWGVWSDLYMNGNNLRMEVTDQARPAFKYTLDAAVSGNNLTWTIATDVITGSLTYISGIIASAGWTSVQQSGRVVTISSAFIYNAAIATATVIAQINTVAFPPMQTFAAATCGPQTNRVIYSMLLDATGAISPMTTYTASSYWSTWSVSYIVP